MNNISEPIQLEPITIKKIKRMAYKVGRRFRGDLFLGSGYIPLGGNPHAQPAKKIIERRHF